MYSLLRREFWYVFLRRRDQGERLDGDHLRECLTANELRRYVLGSVACSTQSPRFATPLPVSLWFRTTAGDSLSALRGPPHAARAIACGWTHVARAVEDVVASVFLVGRWWVLVALLLPDGSEEAVPEIKIL